LALQPDQLDALLDQEERRLYDVGRERVFLALMFKNPALSPHGERLVPPDMVFGISNNCIYRAILLLNVLSTQQGWPLVLNDSTIAYAGELMMPIQEFLKATQGLDHVRSLMVMSQRVDSDEWEQVVHHLRDVGLRVRMHRECRRIQKSVFDRDNYPVANKLAIKAEGAFLDASANGSSNPEEVGLHKLGYVDDTFYKKANIINANPWSGVRNVYCPLFPRWMKLCNYGFERGGMTVVAARTKVGKSTLLQEIARSYAMCDPPVPVLVLDTEMTREETWSRALAAQSGVPEFSLINGKYLRDSDTKQLVDHHREALRSAPFYYVSLANKPPEYAVSMMHYFRNHIVGTRTINDGMGGQLEVTGLGAVVYDWIKIPATNRTGSDKEWQLIGDLCTQIKDAATALDLPVIAGAQGNRGAINKTGREHAEMGESFISGSDRIAHFCSSLCFLRNVDREEQEAILEKFPRRPIQPGDDPRNELLFNQVLHVMLQRRGPNCVDGNPLYLVRETNRYEEGVYESDEQGRPIIFDGGVFKERLHSSMTTMQFLSRNNSMAKGVRAATKYIGSSTMAEVRKQIAQAHAEGNYAQQQLPSTKAKGDQ